VVAHGPWGPTSGLGPRPPTEFYSVREDGNNKGTIEREERDGEPILRRAGLVSVNNLNRILEAAAPPTGS